MTAHRCVVASELPGCPFSSHVSSSADSSKSGRRCVATWPQADWQVSVRGLAKQGITHRQHGATLTVMRLRRKTRRECSTVSSRSFLFIARQSGAIGWSPYSRHFLLLAR